MVMVPNISSKSGDAKRLSIALIKSDSVKTQLSMELSDFEDMKNKKSVVY